MRKQRAKRSCNHQATVGLLGCGDCTSVQPHRILHLGYALHASYYASVLLHEADGRIPICVNGAMCSHKEEDITMTLFLFLFIVCFSLVFEFDDYLFSSAGYDV